MTISIEVDLPAIKKAIEDKARPLAEAATAAMADVADAGRTAGRASIASAGFSARWQRAFRSRVYPEGRDSLSPAAFFFHRVSYSSIFEEGGTITGDPLLWLPLPDTPKTIGGQRTTPRLWASRKGKLRSVNRPGRKPLLFGKLSASAKGDVPLFVGVQRSIIPKKFDIAGAVNNAADRLESAFEKHFRDA
jgi:hypothetical protein